MSTETNPTVGWRRKDVDIDRCRWLYESGMTLAEVAAEMGAGVDTIRRRLRAAGVEIRSCVFRRKDIDVDRCRWLYESGMTLEQVAAELGTGVQSVTIGARLKEAGVELRPAGPCRNDIDLEQAISLYRTGLSLREITQRFDVNRETLKTTLLAAGIELRRTAGGTAVDGFKVRRAARLRGQGMAFHEIAAELGVSVMTARAYCLRATAKAGRPQMPESQTLDAVPATDAASKSQRKETEVTETKDRKAAPVVKFEPSKIEERITAMMREPVRLQPGVVAAEKRYRALLKHRKAIIDAHRDGYGIRRIAKAIGASFDDVKRVLLEAGETPHNPGPPAEARRKGLQSIRAGRTAAKGKAKPNGVAAEDPADRNTRFFKEADKSFQKWIQSDAPPGSSAEIPEMDPADRAARLYAEGATLRQVAGEFGVGLPKARAMIVRGGVEIRPAGINPRSA